MKPPFNTRGFCRFGGELVTVDGVVGWGDGDAERVLYVRVQTAPPELKNQPAMALGLSGALCSICKTVDPILTTPDGKNETAQALTTNP